MKKTLLSTALLIALCPITHATNGIRTQATPIPIEPTTTPVVNQSDIAPVSTDATVTTIKPAPVINCNYHISATSTIDQSIVSTWAEKAIMQAFDFNYTDIDTQLGALKPCFTDQGWQSFNEALLQAGNVNAIKSQHLTVSSQMNGALTITPNKENLWKVTIPMRVVYQNDKERLTQLLTIDLLIGRKVTGDLGIMQMIAVPSETTTTPATPPQ